MRTAPPGPPPHSHPARPCRPHPATRAHTTTTAIAVAIAVALLCLLPASVARAQTPTQTLDLGAGVLLELVAIEPGSFTQGSPPSEPGRNPDESQRSVTLTRPFLLGRFPVTRAQFERFVAESRYVTEAEKGPSGGFGWDGSALRQDKAYSWRNPGFPQGPDHPVTLVTFADAQAFCRWLSSRTRRTFTLPTEAQWEFACRAGTTSAWHAGNQVSVAASLAWSKDNADHQTHPVSSRDPNPWGLHIGGNVAEWCLDWYGPYLPGPVTDPLQENPNLSDRPRRVLRGGSWLRDVHNTRSAARFRNDPGSRNADNGFRVLTFDATAISPPTTRATTPPRTPATPPPAATDTATASPQPQNQAPPAATASTTHHTNPSPRRTALPWVFVAFFVLLVVPAIAIVVFLVSRVKRRPTFANPTPTPNRSPSLITRRHSHLAAPDTANDGFWFASDPSRAGETFLYTYWLHGQLHQGQVIYQPGNDGRQFIYTGERPDRVTLQEAIDDPPDPAPPSFTPDFRRADPPSEDRPTPGFTGLPPAY